MHGLRELAAVQAQAVFEEYAEAIDMGDCHLAESIREANLDLFEHLEYWPLHGWQQVA